MPDVASAVAWLRAWAPGGPWTVVEIDPSVDSPRVVARTFGADELPALEAHVAERNGRVNLYFVPNPHVPYRTAAGHHTTPRKQDVTSACCLMVDLDLARGEEQSDDAISRLVRRVEALDPPATAVVYSGGGVQAFWLFDEPLTVELSVDASGSTSLGPAERAEAVGKAIARELRSDAVQNINRLMRLPGTVNIPSASKVARGRVPAEARVLSVDWSRRWSPSSDPVPTLPEGYWLGDAAAPAAPPSSAHAYDDLPDRWRRLIRSGDASGYGGDRSRLVYALTGALVRRGWTDDEIVALLVNEQYLVSAHVRAQSNPAAYARRQAQRSREAVAADWDRDPRTGSIQGGSPSNVARALGELGYVFRFNSFRDRTMINGATPSEVPLADHHFSEIRVAVHNRFKFMPTRDVLSDAVSVAARAATYDPVLDYLAACAAAHDGVPRISGWLTRYFGVEASPYVAAIGRLMLVATVRRVRQPGCVFDEMMVLMSDIQGLGKSSGIKALVPDEDWYSDSVPLRATQQQVVELLRGKVIVEFSEMTGVQHAEVDQLKAFLSRTTDEARPAYGRTREDVRRRSTFWGTTNSEAFLRDRKNRRFWPVRVPREVDVAAIRADRDQLWGEAALAEAAGESVRLDRSLWVEAEERQEEYRYGDAYVDLLTPHLVNHPTYGELEGTITSSDVWRLLGKPGHARGPVDNGRLTEVMRELGWERKLVRFGAARVPVRSFVRGDRSRCVYVVDDLVTGRLTVTYDIHQYRREDGFDFYEADPNRAPF